MKINGNSLPTKLMSLVEDGLWGKLPEKRDYLETIYSGPVNSLKTLELYGLNLMKLETEGLIEHCAPSYEYSDSFKIFLGELDEEYEPGDIEFSRAIVIGDLGIGSDAPIALDYRQDKNNPSVVILHWFRSEDKIKTRWLRIADSFDEFWQAVCVEG